MEVLPDPGPASPALDGLGDAVEAVDGPDRGPTTADTSGVRSLHHLTVVTPEGVVLEFRAAGVASRTLAKGIDLLIQFVALIAAFFIGAFTVLVSEAFAVVAIIVLIFLIFYGYPTVLETWWDGRTVGKKLFGIRVITTEGGPVRFRHAAIRSLIATFDFWFPTPGGLIAVFFALLTKRSQRLGDLAAGTIVIREAKPHTAPVFFPQAYGAELVSQNLDTSLLDAHNYTLVREFLLRVGDLVPEARYELAEELAKRISAKTGNPRPPGLDGERFLLSILHAHQARFHVPGDPLLPPPGAFPAAPTTWPPPPRSPQPGTAPPGTAPPGTARPGAAPSELAALPPPSGPPAWPTNGRP